MEDKHSKSLSEVHGSVDTRGLNSFWKKITAFFGPAYLVSVGYMDPGNWATDIAGGSKFGYSLVWVLLMSNLMALLLQTFAARMGIVSGKDLAQASRSMYPKSINSVLYGLAEIAIAACDLAEVLGMAIGLNLLFGIPILFGVGISVLDTLVLLYLQKLGMRKMEVFIISLVAIIGLSFFVEIFLAKPDFSLVAKGLIPSIPNNEAVLILIGIIGATVMPHNLYLHSALVQTRKIGNTPKDIWRAIKFSIADSAIALNIALLVNASILILAASVFFTNGYYGIADITDAYKLLRPLVGTSLAPILFAVALIASGQSSTITGTLAGQIIMEGYLHIRIPIWIRRLITRGLAVIPAFIVVALLGDGSTGELLILSQVILSLQLAFAVIPLLHFVGSKSKMGDYVISKFGIFLGIIVTFIIVGFNTYLLYDTFAHWMKSANNILFDIFILSLSGGLVFLLGYVILKPILGKVRLISSKTVHGNLHILPDLKLKHFNNIAIALDFTSFDIIAIEYAISQGGVGATYFLLHVSETAGALISGSLSTDYESLEDMKILKDYVKSLEEQGYHSKPMLGFGNRVQGLVKLVEKSEANLMVMAAHGHSGVRDLLMGETIDDVRHLISIPLLIVN